MFVLESEESSPDFQSFVAKEHLLIARSIVVSDFLLDELSPVKCFADKIPDIGKLSSHGRVEKLLSALKRVPAEDSESVFSEFIRALRRDRQEHVANIFFTESDSDTRPMSDEHWQLLTRSRAEVCRSLDPRNGLLDELVNSGAFSDDDRGQVLSATKTDVDAMSDTAIGILTRKADSAFDLFFDALRKTGQEHIATILRPDSANIPMSEQHREILIQKLADVSIFLDAECGLRIKLLSSGVFGRYDDGRVKSIQDYREQAEEIISILMRKSDGAFHQFIDLLNETGQEHVAYILTGKGVPPLSRLRLHILQQERQKLIECIDSENSLLIDRLFALGVLNATEMKVIAAQETNYRKNRLVLDTVSRKYQSAYDRFLQALKDVGQDHIATALEGLELNGLVDPKFQEGLTVSQQNAKLPKIRSIIETLLRSDEGEIGNLMAFMVQNGFTLSSVSEGSVLITFRCFTIQSLANLKKLYTDKTLNQLFTETFCPEFSEEGLESLTLNIKSEQFEKCEEIFKQMALMTYEHRTALFQTAKSVIAENIAVTGELLDLLPLSQLHIDTILRCSVHAEQVATLFEIMTCRPDTVFCRVVDALRKTGQNQVADFIFHYCVAIMTSLPVELLEVMLMRTFIKLFTDHYKSHYKTHEAIAATYSALAAVCYSWRQTMDGWPESTTRHWFRHQLHRAIQCMFSLSFF